LGELHEVVSFWFLICDSFAHLRRLVYYRSIIACKMQGNSCVTLRASQVDR
jgi:hypothetical protein